MLHKDRRDKAIISVVNKFGEGGFFAEKYKVDEYYLSAKQAEQLIYGYMRGVFPKSEDRKRLQYSLYSRYLEIRKAEPELPMQEVFMRVVCSETDEFFISKKTLRRIINNEKRKGEQDG